MSVQRLGCKSRPPGRPLLCHANRSPYGWALCYTVDVAGGQGGAFIRRLWGVRIMKPATSDKRLITVLRWIARVWSLIIAGVVLLIIVMPDENVSGPVPLIEWVEVGLVGVAAVALLLAWRWEAAGALIALVVGGRPGCRVPPRPGHLVPRDGQYGPADADLCRACGVVSALLVSVTRAIGAGRSCGPGHSGLSGVGWGSRACGKP